MVPYFLWAFVYFLYPFGLKMILIKVSPDMLNHPELDNVWNWTWLDWVHGIFGYSAKEGAGELPDFFYQF